MTMKKLYKIYSTCACSFNIINNGLHLVRKYTKIFVQQHYLFWEARVKLEENCELWGTDNVQGQNNIQTYFLSQMEAMVFIILQIFIATGKLVKYLYHSVIPQF